MGKKAGSVLGNNLLKSKGTTKKTKRLAQQEGYLHNTDLQDDYDWGKQAMQVMNIKTTKKQRVKISEHLYCTLVSNRR